MHTLEVIINNFILLANTVKSWGYEQHRDKTKQVASLLYCAALKVHVNLVLARLTNICIGKRTSQSVKSCNIDLLACC